ncbi:MAG: DUF1284 domain-containing protein [Nitrospirae bacterium]|nr:DUF1284 domain-containing protein [Nitrospirota bacterium]
MPGLRGHHLICLHFFHGEGYNEEFVQNLREVLRSAENGETEVRRGGDDVCRKCPYLDRAGCRYSDTAEEGIAEMDRKALALLRLSHGAKVKWNETKHRLPDIFRTWYDTYCIACSWRRACEKDDGFRRLTESCRKTL